MTPAIPTQPGEALRDLLDERGISQIRAAQVLGISRGHLNSIINGHNPISADIKLKLQDFLNVPHQHWTRLQDQQDDFAASPEGKKHLREARQEQFLEQLRLQTSGRLTRSQLHEAVLSEWLGLSPFSPTQLVQGGCYWLGLGLRGFVSRLKDPAGRPVETEVLLKPSLELAPGEVLTVLSHEKIVLPQGMIMRVVNKSAVFCGADLRLECSLFFGSGLSGGVALHIINDSGRAHILRHQEQALLVQFEYDPDEDSPGPS
jgi:addiction module HigA family antidote